MEESFLKLQEEKKERIIASAIHAFATYGYENANTNLIAKDAGISVGSLFQYFDNKEELFLTIVDYCSELLIAIFSEMIKEEDSFYETIEKIVARIINVSRSNPDLVKLYYEMATPNKSEMTVHLVDKLERASSSSYEKLIKKGQEEGIVRRDIEPGAFAFFLDNLFVMLQYSYSCGYYKERFKLYFKGQEPEEDLVVIEQFMKFVKGTFSCT